MKNRAESVSSPNTSEKVSPWRKLIAVGALSTIALTGCAADNAEAKPEPTKTEQVTEEPTKSPEPIETTEVKSAVPPIRPESEWHLNKSALADLGGKIESFNMGYGEYPTNLQASVCSELLSTHITNLGFEQNPMNSPQEILAVDMANREFMRQYQSDIYRNNKDAPSIIQEYKAVEACTLNFPQVTQVDREQHEKNEWDAVAIGDSSLATTSGTLLRYTDKFRSADPVVWLNVTRQIGNLSPVNVWSAYVFDKNNNRWNIIDEVNADEGTPEGAMISSPVQ